MNSLFRSNRFILIVFSIQIIASLTLAPLFQIINLPLPLILLSGQVLLLVPSIIYLLNNKQTLKETLHFKKINMVNMILIILISFAVQPLMLFLSSIGVLFFDNSISEIITQMNSLPLIVLVLLIGVTPAICEELVMRGIFFSGYKNININMAALINGLFFGMLHFNLQQFLYAFALGFLFAYLVYITGSIFSSVIAHFTINSSQVIFQRLTLEKASELGTNLDSIATVTFIQKLGLVFYTYVFTTITIPFLILIFYSLLKYNKERINQNIILNLEENKNIINGPFILATIIYLIFVLITLISML